MLPRKPLDDIYALGVKVDCVKYIIYLFRFLGETFNAITMG